MTLKRVLIFFSILLGVVFPLAAQMPAGTLRMQVLDPSGASVVDAVVLVKSAAGTLSGAQVNKEGIYEIKGLAPGSYSVQAMAKGFAPFDQAGIEIVAGQVKNLEIHLQIEMQQEEVEVTGQSPNVSVNPTSNVSALVIKGADLDALSDDPEELAADLQALAGPAAGPSGGQIYIDGFTGGRLPPKSSIREIRINQNPFSAQFDRLGYGRTEIFTKPGADKLHGQISANFNQSAVNSRNPFVIDQPGYHSERFSGDLGAALSKKASFFISAERRNITDTSIVSAYVLDSNFDPAPFNQAFPNPRTRTEISPRIDYQLSPNNTLTVRYQYDREDETNNGIGLFSLPSQGFDLVEDEHTIQVSDTQILGARTVNETRFRYQRQDADRVVYNFDPTLRVLSAFTGGGNNEGTSLYRHNHYELQNYTSISAGKHLVKFGGRLQVIKDVNNSNSDFNGTFTFGSLDAYRITELGLQQGWTPAEIRAAGGGADQFSIVTGNPRTGVTLADVGIYLEDDWRLRPNLSLSLGMRYETQNEINDHADFAPRVSLAWGLGRSTGAAPKTVLRAGFGLFYDRFGRELVLRARRLNGLNQQQFVVPQPDFYPEIPDLATLAGSQIQPTVYQIDPVLHSPYLMQTAVSIERQLSKTMTASLTYVNSRGWKQLLTRNINAPLPGTYDPSDPTSGDRPLGDIGNIYRYESAGIFRQNQLIANINVRGGRMLSLFSNYTLNYARGNTSGASSFPVNQYDLMSNYGRAQFDVRHRAFLGGTVNLPHAFSLNSFIVASSGMPFDISLGQDLNGDSIFNDRPAIATDLTRPSVVQTAWGNLDTLPAPGDVILAPNYGTGPSLFRVNMRLSKTFGFGKQTESSSEGSMGGPGGPPGGRRGGPRGGPSGGLGPRGLSGGGGWGDWGGASVNRRYSLTLSVFARNVFNFVNLAAPVGNLSSPLFGQSNAIAGGPFFSSAANRRIDFQVTFTF
jgi:hypothetical protein